MGRYRVELSCESPKVPFCTALGTLLFLMTQIYLHKNFTFQSTTLLKLNYLYLLIIINYPYFIRCVTANQVAGLCHYFLLFVTICHYFSICVTTFYCERYFRPDFDCLSFQFRWGKVKQVLLISNF